jgi:hypothetical protein
MTTLNELKITFWKRETSSASNTFDDLERAYYNLRVTTSPTVSIADKKLSYLRTKTGLAKGSISDLEKIYWAAQVPAATNGSYQDRARAYYSAAPVGS